MTKVFLSLLLPALGIFTSEAAASNMSPKEMAIPGIELSADTSVTLKKSAHLPKDTVLPAASPATLAVKQAAQAMPVVVRNPKVYEQMNNHYITGYVNDYATRYSQHLAVMVERAAPYFTMIEKVFTDHGIPEEMKYLAVIESGMTYNARSRVGAVGMWQFMSSTARIFGLSVGKKVDERKDFYKSTVAAAKFLNELYEQFDDWLLVVAAYNCGAGGVQRAQKISGRSDFWGIQYFLPAESRNHVYKFIATGYILDRFNTFFGVSDNYAAPAARMTLPAEMKKTGPLSDEDLYNTVVFNISGKYKLEAIAKKLSVDAAEMERLNPNFASSLAGETSSYDLRIPKEKMKTFQAEKEEILKESLQLTLDDKAATVDKSRFPAPVKRPEVNANTAKKKVVTAKKTTTKKKKTTRRR
ncbi:transglycosylase SLT domain-containing protein [Chitinophaga sp. SYP-B3965]|uniref:lytic transglycosylase domain-containing protein n=1 Tax=Chitinophaga sp. SYP-B3965 TaxID=2663120 RepID=UPI001299FB78|nr:lytic transglycosylase domain-containing protein [Chitinophaga sp. SYP-B3965]MRG47884.1 transglycosylase SLT domain-containing protein [Chitinophaga sp. SYP-B3965]